MPPLPPLVRVSDTLLKLGKIELDTRERSISFPAKLNMTKGNLEYLLVADYGKVHEALLSTEVQPFFLNVVMLLMKYEKVENFFPDLPPESKKEPKAVLNDSNSFECKLSWTGQNGEAQTALLTEWLQNELTKKSVPRTRWGYTCSTVDDKGVFEPQIRGSIIAVYRDPSSMINSPLDGNDNDEIWVPAPKLPAVGTKVQVTFFPYREAEAKVAPTKK
jgi:hypothetical protein